MDDKEFHILLIEDSDTYALLVGQMLSTSEAVTFRVHRANCLKAGLRRLAEGHIDAVLLDLTLPETQGLHTLAAVAAAARGVPVVVLTAVDDENVAMSALQEGAADYLVKGEVTPSWLVRSVRYAIERTRAEKPAVESVGTPEPAAVTRIERQTIDDVTIVRFRDERIVSPVDVEHIEAELLRLAAQIETTRVLIDFAGVEYFSNAAMGMLIKLDKKLRAEQGSLSLCQMSDDVHEHFSIRHLNTVFRIFETQEMALQAP